MNKVFITDLDHTFLRNDLTISDFSKKIWNEMASRHIMSVATARAHKKTMQFLDGFAINAPLILLDGALVVTKEKKIIDTKFIIKSVADDIIDKGVKLGIYPFVIALADENLHESFLYTSTLKDFQKTVLDRYTIEDNLEEKSNLKAMDKNFKLVYMAEENLLRELLEELKSVFGETLKYILAPEAYVGCYFLTILYKDADKSHGIKSVSEYMGFDMKKLTVFGDNFNDLGMFELAGISVAMANAQDGVKDAADIILPHTNDEDGVAKYLEGLH